MQLDMKGVAPRVVNIKDLDQPPWDNTVRVDRQTKWGNPFKIGHRYNGKMYDRSLVIEAYGNWYRRSWGGRELQAVIHKLRGKDLACHCSPEPCHADFLLEEANK